MESLVHTLLLCLLPALAGWLIVSGCDDFFLDLLSLVRVWRHRGRALPTAESLRARPEKRIAIVVPLWREHRVIGAMLDHNVAAIQYRRYDIFVGAYPNDEATLDAVRAAEARHARVRLAVCPHDGPTSKADCLNWIYQRLLLSEEEGGERYDVIVTHDAEDLIHPQSLQWINALAEEYGMIQMPVLPLSTPWFALVHGVYCDEFSEFQLRDQPARVFCGSFLPSAGVGTGYTRVALEALADTANNCVFEPVCLTEDYENGLRLHRMGFRQCFLPVHLWQSSFVATREYFPQHFRAAIRQRTRWMTGIALQTWERHGWQGSWRERYWLWRDRKGLLGNPLTLVTNTLAIAALTGWHGYDALPNGVLVVTGFLQAWRLCSRVWLVSRTCGWVFAAGVPVRAVVANTINCLATLSALIRYGKARWHHLPLVWLKTEHAYPHRQALLLHKPRLGDLLLTAGSITEEQLDTALATQPAGLRLGEHLVRAGFATEEDVCAALSWQQGLPTTSLGLHDVTVEISRSFPAKVARQWKVLPFRVAEGSLHVAAADVPDDAMQRALQRHTRLALRFHLMTPTQFEELAGALL